MEIIDESSFNSLALDPNTKCFLYDKVILQKDISFSDLNKLTKNLPFGWVNGECIPFTGVFDGHGHVIDNLVLNGENSSLFCGLKKATVKNLVINSSCSFEGELASAISVKVFGDVTFDNVTNRAVVKGKDSAGAFISEMSGLADSLITINNSLNEANVTFAGGSPDGADAGGFIGRILNTKNVSVYFLQSTSNEKVNGKKDYSVGGFIGRVAKNQGIDLHFRGCRVEFPNSEVSDGDGDKHIGGFIGQVNENDRITLLIEEIEIKGEMNVFNRCNIGGFAGCIEGNSILNIFAKQLVIATDVSTSNSPSYKYIGGFAGVVRKNINSTIHISTLEINNNIYLMSQSYYGGVTGHFNGNENMTFIVDDFITKTIVDSQSANELLHIGGLFGCIESNIFTNVTFTRGVGESSMKFWVGCNTGGFVGFINGNSDTDIIFNNCTHTGTINGYNQGKQEVGGFVGIVSNSNDEKTLLFFKNCINSCDVDVRTYACGFFCVGSIRNDDVESTVENCINKGTISGESAYGVASNVTNASNVVNLGAVEGQNRCAFLWWTGINTSSSYSLESSCSDTMKDITLFFNISGTYCTDMHTCEPLNNALNNVSRSNNFGMMWTNDLKLVKAIRVIVGPHIHCDVSTIFGDTLEQISEWCQFSLDEFIVAEKGKTTPLEPTQIFAEDTELSLCHEVFFTGDVTKNGIAVHGTSLGEMKIAKDLIPPRFHMTIVGNEEVDCNMITVVEKDMTVKVTEWFLVTANGVVNESDYVQPMEPLETVKFLKPYFNDTYAVVDATTRKLLSTATPVSGNMSVLVKEFSRLELELELELEGSDTGSEARDRLEEAIRDIVDGAIGSVDIVESGDKFIVRISVVDDTDADEIKDILFSCTTTNKN